MPELNPFIVEHIAPGVIKERSANGRLVIFIIENTKDETFDAWVDAVRDTLARWPNSYPCLMVYDLHKTGELAFDFHMQDSFRELYGTRPELERYVAVEMPNSSVDVARLDVKIRELIDKKHKHLVHWEVFTNRKEALEWLLSKVE